MSKIIIIMIIIIISGPEINLKKWIKEQEN